MSRQSHSPTQKDIAAKAGVHYATVSLALKGHPSIPPATRQRIQKIAQKIGYTPDPMLSALAAYRNQNRPAAGFHGVLAWLTSTTDTFDWREFAPVRRYYAGACQRARDHGYKVEIFELNTPGMSHRRMASIFRARNIRGILLCPQPQARMELKFSWEDFSCVTFGHTLAKPHLHTVTPSHYVAMLQTMRELHQLGYRRIGFVHSPNHDRRIEHHFLAGFLVEQKFNCTTLIPPLLEDVSRDTTALVNWLHLHQPDALVTGDDQILRFLKKIDLRIPKELGVACAGLPLADPVLAGVIEQSHAIGGAGVDFLVSLLHRGERGIPSLPQRLHVDGIWSAGKSLQQLV